MYLQITGSPELTTLLIYVVSFVVLTLVSLLWASRIQATMVLSQATSSLNKLQTLKENSRKELLNYVKNICGAPTGSETRIDETLEYFTIMPVDLDPRGVVGKIEQVIRAQDDRIRAELRAIAPKADRVQISVAENILAVATSLNSIFKLVRHIVLMGRKTKSLYLVVQLQMILPTIIQEAEAWFGAIESFKLAQPIGDGLGPLVAGKLMVGKEKFPIERETVYAQNEYKGRILYILKSEGPLGTVGRLDVGVEKLVQDTSKKISAIVMIDAALKLEGEKTGEVAEGIGAAIGGIGVEKYKIESIAVENKIPTYAIVVKESVIDNMSVMIREIADAPTKVVDAIHRLIEEKTKEGDSILIVGVGNTLGIGQ